MYFLEVPIPDDLYEAAKLDRDLIEQITLRDEGEGSQLISRTYEVRYVQLCVIVVVCCYQLGLVSLQNLMYMHS